MSWYYFPKRTAKPVKNGIKVKNKRGEIGEQWWSKRFIEALNQMGMDNRLQRGRTYARKGQVINIDFEDGVVSAKVQGSSSRPYEVSISLKPWTEEDWGKVIEAISEQALFAAQLLAGEMPHEMIELVEGIGLDLFPQTTRDLDTDCSCPDYANPCKHIAAVYYILAERFDDDPFLLFAIRGKGRDAILDALRELRGDEPEATESEEIAERSAPIPELTAEGFYDLKISLDSLKINISRRPEVRHAVIKRLGPSPFQIGKRNMNEILSEVYDIGPEYIQKMVHQDILDKDHTKIRI